MNKFKKLAVGVAGLLLIAACGSGGDAATTSTISSTATSSVPETTAAEAPTTTAAETTTTAGETTTTAASEATGDLGIIQAAMARTAESAPSLVEGTINMVGVDPGDGNLIDVSMPFTVRTDAATGNTAMVMDMGAMAAAMGTEGVPAEMAALFGEMEVRQIGDTAYLKFPFFTSLMGAQTEWVSMPAEESGDLSFGMSGGANPSGATGFLDSLSGADGTVEELGPEDVRGIATTKYHVVIDDDWQESLAPEELAKLEEQGSLPETSFPMNVWVDGDGLVHRMSMDVTAAEMAEVGEDQGDIDDFESMSMTFDFFDFGQAVAIEPPPADQVTDAADLGGMFGGTTTP